MAKRVVGITGLAGFVGQHLSERIIRGDSMTTPHFEDDWWRAPERLDAFLEPCDAIVHLAAMNRGDPDEIYRVNVSLVKTLVQRLEQLGSVPHVVFASSTQCELDNPYGRSKREGAQILQEWAQRTGASLTVLVIPNVFGDRGRPHYNSVVATFCHQLTHGETPTLTGDKELDLIAINDLTDVMHDVLADPPDGIDVRRPAPTGRRKISQLLNRLREFRDGYFADGTVPAFEDRFDRVLYNVFVSYMDAVDYGRRPQIHADARGSLFEIVRHSGSGQVFYSTTKPGITRGNHYHTRKMEKFCVVAGEAAIRLRRIETDEVVEYRVTGDTPSIIEIPIYYTHNIENVGASDLMTLFWANEVFDPTDADTWYEEV